VLNATFTFAVHARRGLRIADYLTFALTQAGGFIAHTAVLVAAAPHIPLVVAKLLGIGVGFLVNFSLARTIVFRTR
jgi:putative flippase GtrA